MISADRIAQLLTVGEAEQRGADPRVAGLVALAGQMGTLPPTRDTPVREVMARLGDNWSSLLLKVLSTGTFRHATLKRMVGELSSEGEISQRMLTLRLRALERDGFVQRSEDTSVPPRVTYALTPMGQGLVAELDRMLIWIERHTTEIEASRALYGEP